MDAWYRQAITALLESKIQHCDELLTAVTYCMLAERRYLLLETPNGQAKDIHSLSFGLEQMNSVLGLSTCIVSVMEGTHLSDVMSGFLQKTSTHSKDNCISAERTTTAMERMHSTTSDGSNAVHHPHSSSSGYGSTMGIVGDQAQHGSSGSSFHGGIVPGSNSATASTMVGYQGVNTMGNTSPVGNPANSSGSSEHQKSDSQTNQPAAAATSSARGETMPGHKKSSSQTNTTATTSTTDSNAALESIVTGMESDAPGRSAMHNSSSSSSSSFGQQRSRPLRNPSNFRSKPARISQESGENSTHLMHMENNPSHHHQHQQHHHETTASGSIAPSDLSFQIGGATRHQHQNSISGVSSNITRAPHSSNKRVANVVVLEILERISSEFFLALLEIAVEHQITEHGIAYPFPRPFTIILVVPSSLMPCVPSMMIDRCFYWLPVSQENPPTVSGVTISRKLHAFPARLDSFQAEINNIYVGPEVTRFFRQLLSALRCSRPRRHVDAKVYHDLVLASKITSAMIFGSSSVTIDHVMVVTNQILGHRVGTSSLEEILMTLPKPL